MKEELRNIIRTPLEDVMHDCFMPYAEYVILERAIPRVEDGLKPVQRHILYSMHEMQVWPTASHRKCARIVGDTMGKYHPHGDTSIYEALARMAQDFSMSAPLIDGQGNFGSIDGDSPAAMRYTEARLAPIALEMLRDLDKETVPFQLNFDDSLQEPTLLPSRFPNLLVNGSTGIAVGMATNIPPHNLGEVIDGTIYRIQNPDCSLDELMERIKGPDFPTGGVILGREGLREAYETGRGRIHLRAKTELESVRGGKTRIVITELPYEVRESKMLQKIQQLRAEKKEMFAAISDVRSETDRTGLRAVIELKNGADVQKVLDCLFKYSDMQISYGINMLTIADGQPKLLGLASILDYYIAHQRSVVKNRVQFDIEQAQEKEHRLAGLIIAVSNIDLVISIIRTSANTKTAKSRLMNELAITGVQAQAILDLRLARLTQLEVDTLQRDYADVVALLKKLSAILHSAKKLDGVIIDELSEIRQKYACRRRTPFSAQNAEIAITENDFKVSEECAVVLTNGGNLKRMSKKLLLKGAEGQEIEHKNLPAQVVETTSDGRIQLLTDLGSIYTISAELIRESKVRDAGSTVNSVLAGLERGEKILRILAPGEGRLLTVTRAGLVKFTDRAELSTRKGKMLACGLREGDRLMLAEPDDAGLSTLLLVTRKGMSIRFNKSEISQQGRSGKGVGGISLQRGDEIILAAQINGEGSVVAFTDQGFAKQTRIGEYEVQGRNGKGLKAWQWMKNGANGSLLAGAFYIKRPAAFLLVTKSGQQALLTSSEIPADARYGKGAQLVPVMLGDVISQVEIQ